MPFIIWNPASNEDRQEGDEEIYGWSDRKLLHLSSPSPLECLTKTTIHPQTPAPHRVWARSFVEKPGVTAVLPNTCGSKVRLSCFYEGGIVGWGWVGFRTRIEVCGGRVKTNPYIHPVLEQATASHILTTLTASFLKSDKSWDTRTKGKDKKGQTQRLRLCL